MTHDRRKTWLAASLIVALMLVTSGCKTWSLAKKLYDPPPSPAPLGSISDTVWKSQEANAEASKYVVVQHEFKFNSPILNQGGEEHVKMIAARLNRGQEAPVIIERSNTNIDPTSEFQYPVNPNPELDLQRRQVVVMALTRLGVEDADSRVIAAPALTRGTKSSEDENAYLRAFNYRPGMGGYGGGGYPGNMGVGFGFGGGNFGPFGR